jgi:AraC family transcriptional regulator of adaptative response/methylated-DNA-[protein]-cysteine methyltransferase
MPSTHAKLAEAIDYLVAHYQDQPDLDSLAVRFGYEPTYFQKIFKEHVGISPKRFVQFMSLRTARDFLLQGATTLDAAYAAGLSGTGRLHDLFVQCEAVTPGEVQKKGRGLTIRYGCHATPLGELFVAVTSRGVCWLSFQVDETQSQSLKRLKNHFPHAALVQDQAATEDATAQIMKIWRGQGDKTKKLSLDLYGTNFQLQVWQAMLKIPMGMTVSYMTLADALGKPTASRAVGGAVGANPVSLLIPCHRVIQQSGIIENYGWGSARKKALLGMEVAAMGLETNQPSENLASGRSREAVEPAI